MILRVFLVCAVVSVSLGQGAPTSVPTKPVWPLSFDYQFGVTVESASPPLINVTGILHYQWPLIQTQLIDYPERCIPLNPGTDKAPCKLLFNSAGVAYSSPQSGIDCCLAIPSVGSIPPAFLKAFQFSDVQNATDYLGRERLCDHWVGGAFEAWTDRLTGLDVRINDGPNTVWHVGAFNVRPQAASVFRLPGDCSKACPASLNLAERIQQHAPIARLTALVHQQRRDTQ